MDTSKLAFWEKVADQLPYLPFPPPPSSLSGSDIDFFAGRAQRAFELLPPNRAMDALMLGMTPGIAAMRWPEPTDLVALDWSGGMIRHQWPHVGLPRFAAPVQADWRRMPLADACRDFAAGDGCQMAVASLADCAAYHAEVCRVLRPGGHFAQRCILRPEQDESLDALFEQLFAGKMPNFEVFRRRLAMALHGPNREGVRAGDVWRVWNERVRDRRALLACYGWPAETLLIMERWKDSEVRFPFPTLRELLELVGPEMELIECDFPSYDMGELCPRLVLRKR